MSHRGVLIVTNEHDVEADLVVRELVRRDHGVVRLNTERFESWRIAVEPGRAWTLEGHGRRLHSEGCSGVWWRRPESAATPRDVADEEWAVICAHQFTLISALQHVDGPRWMSRPSAIRVADDKARQLVAAAAAGFRVPATTWTNDVIAAEQRLVAHGGHGIAKPTATAYWEHDDTSHFVFAHAIGTAGLPRPDSLAPAPLAFQQRIEAKRDVRVTVVGTAAFAAVTDDATIDEPDWRLADTPMWAPYELPPEIRQRCVLLVADLGLLFAGVDLLVDADGEHWFCELNPNGEWGWLDAAGLPIAEAIAAELTQ
ncbi:hypothetical protein OM076_13745 [Solirubrobacter ginsenosidimutans]|uniref:ATP-grasp ribosomal peptide maturase n=1 Tax=Solirubrobacter ginsenosidimutans TaxID=490573 RepID=A0A9X3MT24_9ACTN|nr:hypothetical protein [Solirubrobacter ginsenosidimutans]MDA0161336.1 hypothetical protein [Solirubrobacter ginsenosidimutans]